MNAIAPFTIKSESCWLKDLWQYGHFGEYVFLAGDTQPILPDLVRDDLRELSLVELYQSVNLRKVVKLFYQVCHPYAWKYNRTCWNIFTTGLLPIKLFTGIHCSLFELTATQTLLLD